MIVFLKIYANWQRDTPVIRTCYDMSKPSSIYSKQRTYNKWVANETLEDFALRYTAKRARKWSSQRVANTALGVVSFLALEAIGGAITLSYGFTNAFYWFAKFASKFWNDVLA